MWQFIRQTFVTAIGTIIGLSLFFTVGISGLIVLLIVGSNAENKTFVKNDSVLVFDLSLNITDTEPASNLTEVLSRENNNTIPLRQVILALKNAAKDTRIKAILLDGRKTGLGNGYANLTEVKNELLEFKKQGKKIIAYDHNITEAEYYLMSAANEIILHPLGSIAINGFSSQQTFFNDALEKYGIGVQIVRVGDYKAAVEPFIRNNFSPENREQNESLLTDIWQNYKETIAKNRENLTVNNLQNIADSKGFLNAEEGIKNKLIDQLAYDDEIITKIQSLTTKDNTSFPQIKINNYDSNNLDNQTISEHKIAVVYAEGTIVNGEGNPQEIGANKFAQELKKIRENKDIKAVVLRINSPGGSATASDIITRELELIKKEKPVIISMGNVAASGGYWIATGGDYIFAENSTITGSIGVFGVLFNIEEIANNNGISWDTVKTGKFADFQTITRPKNEAEIAHYQQNVKSIYDIFLKKVSQARKLPENKVKSIAQGKVWSGKMALEIGLVDEIGGLEKAIAFAAKKANLGNSWEVEEYPQKRTFEEEFFEDLLETKLGNYLLIKNPILPPELTQFEDDFMVWKTFNDPRHIYARILLNINWD